jgi:hypothetical protein
MLLIIFLFIIINNYFYLKLIALESLIYFFLLYGTGIYKSKAIKNGFLDIFY